MLQFAADPLENRAIWKGLPGQSWLMLSEPRPSATVWASTVLPLEQPPGTEPPAIMVHHYLGAGQVVWIGFDGTWRWRHRAGDTFHHRFWGQLARWAAANKVTSGNEFVRFGPLFPDLELGHDATIRAKWMPQFLQKNPGVKAFADLFKTGDTTGRPFTTVALLPSATNALQYEGKAGSLPAGEYRIALRTENADLGAKPVEATLYVHDQPSQELSELAANRDLLTQVADASGGRLFLLDQIQDLPRQFKSFDGNISKYDESPLWDRWPWLVLLCGLLTAEWVIRKLHGLP